MCTTRACRVEMRDPNTAAVLGSRDDIEFARRPAGTTQVNMSLDNLAEFLQERIRRLTDALARLSIGE
jgi:hypothetical protein